MKVVFNNIGAPEKKVSLNASSALNGDIISAVNSSFKEAVKQTATIAENFKGSTPVETCKNIWDFLRNEINYVKDPEGYQFIRQPKAFLAAKKGDCKSFSLFAAGVLKNIYPDAKIYLRFAGYSGLNIPTHVYTIIVINNKKIICDGVYKYFGKEKKHTYKKDFQMKVYTLSGIDNVETINGKGRIKAAIKKATGAVKNAVSPQAAAKKDAPKKLKDRVKGIIKKTVKGGKKVGFAPSRAAFLALVKINKNGLAKKILLANAERPTDVKNIWEKVGGEYSQLIKTAQSTGAKINGIGFLAPAAVAEGVKVAAPIITFFIDLFKKLKNKGADDADTKNLDDLSTQALNEEGLTKDEARSAADTADSPGSSKNLLYVGLGAAALLALGGKKLFKS